MSAAACHLGTYNQKNVIPFEKNAYSIHTVILGAAISREAKRSWSMVSEAQGICILSAHFRKFRQQFYVVQADNSR
jgi:hypothetical protein